MISPRFLQNGDGVAETCHRGAVVEASDGETPLLPKTDLPEQCNVRLCYGAYASVDSVAHIPLRHWEPGTTPSVRTYHPPEGFREALAAEAAKAPQADLAPMSIGHAPWNYDALSRQTITAQLISDFCLDMRMRFKSYVGKPIDGDALERVKAEILKTMQELLPNDVVLVEQDPEHPDILNVVTYAVEETKEVEDDQG